MLPAWSAAPEWPKTTTTTTKGNAWVEPWVPKGSRRVGIQCEYDVTDDNPDGQKDFNTRALD